MTKLLTPREAELVSYLTGLAPVGWRIKLVEGAPEMAWILSDLRICRGHIAKLLSRLKSKGIVRNVATGWWALATRLEDPSVEVSDGRGRTARRRRPKPQQRRPLIRYAGAVECGVAG